MSSAFHLARFGRAFWTFRRSFFALSEATPPQFPSWQGPRDPSCSLRLIEKALQTGPPSPQSSSFYFDDVYTPGGRCLKALETDNFTEMRSEN